MGCTGTSTGLQKGLRLPPKQVLGSIRLWLDRDHSDEEGATAGRQGHSTQGRAYPEAKGHGSPNIGGIHRLDGGGGLVEKVAEATGISVEMLTSFEEWELVEFFETADVDDSETMEFAEFAEAITMLSRPTTTSPSCSPSWTTYWATKLEIHRIIHQTAYELYKKVGTDPHHAQRQRGGVLLANQRGIGGPTCLRDRAIHTIPGL